MNTFIKLITLCALPLFANAQIVSSAQTQIVNIPLNQNRSGSNSGSASTNSLSFTQTVIGTTLYDFQSNEGNARRIVNNSNGTISAAWTISTDPAQNVYTDRGTGYNFYNGTTWGVSPTARIESIRTGFTNIAVTGGKEYVLAHSNSNGGVLTSRNLGSGSWTSVNNVGGTSPGLDNWFRLAAGGSNGTTIHAIVNSQGTLVSPILGQSGPITYSRSSNGGATWDIQHVVLPGSNSTFYTGFGAENYSIDCSGDTVVIAAGLPLHDVVLWKSINNGTSWTKTIIQAAPVAAYNTTTNYTSLKTDINGDGVGDTVTTCSGDISVTIDINGSAWVTWSNLSVCDNDISTGNFFIKENSYGISYWKEGMSSPSTITGLADQNNDGRFTVITNSTYDPFSLIYKRKGLTCQPQIGFDPQNNIFLVYSAVCETSDTVTYQAQYRHIYLTYSTDTGLTWSIPEDLTITNNREGLWPSIAKSNTSRISIVYQRDAIPDIYLGDGSGGSALCPLNAGQVNDIVYVGVQNPALSSIVILSGSNSVCRNGTATYSLSNTTGATGYAWTVPTGATILSGQNTSSITVQFGSTSGNVQVVTTFSGGVTVGKTLNVTVQSVTLTTSVTNNNYCAGGSATLNASGASTYAWSPSTGLSGTTGSSVSANPATSTTYTVTATSSNGCTTTSTVAVTVRSNPTVSLSASATNLCSGSGTTLTASGASTYAWSPSAGLSASTGSVVTATPSATSTYTVTGTSSGGCTASNSVTLTILSRPTISSSATNSTLCSGSTTTLTASGANTYAWSPSSGLSGTNGASVTASPSTNITYTVTGTAANGCTSTSTISLAVNTRPNISVTANNSSICNGTSAILTATGAASYAWSPSGGLSAVTGAIVNANPSTTSVYTVTGTAVNGCTSSGTVSLTILPTPAVSASTTASSVCPGSATDVTATGASTYAWSPSTGLNAISGNPVQSSPAVTTTYTVIGTAANGCTATNTVTVVVSPVTITAATYFSTICAGDITFLNANGGLSYLWSPTNGLTDSTSAGISAEPFVTTTYTVVGTTVDGCTGSATLTVNVSTGLNVNVTTANTNVCSGTTATLNATGAQTFNWFPSTDLNDTVGSSVVSMPTSSITYTVTGSSGSGCTGTATITLDPVNNPSVNINATSGTICSGRSTTLTASGANIYAWSPSTGLSSSSGSSVTATPTSGTTYTVTGTDANGCTNTDVVTISVNLSPTVNANAVSNTICSGTSTTLSASGAASYAWSPSVGLSSTTGVSVTATPLSTQTYTVTGTAANTCIATASVSLAVDANPVISASATNATICSGNNTTLSASGGITYSWSPSAGLSGTTGASVVANPVNTTIYTVTGTGANGCTATTTVTITVNTVPSVNVSGNAAICSGLSTTLTATGAATYAWSPSNGLNATAGSSVTANPSLTTTYTVTGTAANGCTSTTSRTLTVNTTPVVAVSASNPAVCSGAASTLSASGASTYAWSPSTGLSSTTGSSVTATPVSAITYTVTGTSANSCTATSTVALAVSSNPVVGINTSNASVCSGSSATLTGTGAVTYNWSPSAGLNATSGTSVVASPSSTTIYTVTGTNSVGCSSTNTITVTVNNRPTISTSGNGNVCSGSTTSLSAIGASTFSWSPAGGLNTTIGAAVTATVSGNIVYTVTGTAANGCTATSTVAITALSNPIVTASSSSPAVCSGTPTTLTAAGASTYVWSPVTGLSSSSGTSVTATATVAVTYTVTGTAANGCTATSTIGISVSTIPTVTASVTNATICSGANTILNASGASTYAWSPASGLSVTTGPSVTATPLTSTTYTVTGTNAAGCTETATVDVIVNATPAVSATAVSNALCPGSSTSITATGATSYSWSPSSGLNTTSGATVIANPASTTTYTVTGSDGTGCSSSSTVTITVAGNPTIVATTATPSVCPGASATLSVSGASTYVWSPSTGLSGTTGSAVIATPAATTTYTVIGTATGGCSSSTTVTVTVNSNPIININAGASGICPGGNLSLTAGGASSYSWSPSAGLNTTSGASVIASPATPTIYTVTGTNSSGCTATSSVSISVFSLPNVNSNATLTSVCPGALTILSATGASTYSWSPSAGLSSTTGAAVTATPLVSTLYTVTGTSANGCISTSTVSVNVNAASIIVDETFFCISAGNNVTINASGAVSYVWSPSQDLSSTTDSTVIASPATTTVYTVEGTNASGCTATVEVTVNVGNFPFTVLQTGNPTPCVGDEAYFIAQTTSAIAQFQWYKDGNLLTGENNDSLPITGSGNYQLQITIGPCDTISDPIAVTVFPAATIPVISTSQSGSCTLQRDTLFSSGTYSLYAWSNGGTNAFTSINSSGIYSVTVTDGNGCTATSLPYDYTTPFVNAAQICLVTVDSLSGKNMVVWEKPSLFGIDSFYVYKEDITTGIYTRIASLDANLTGIYIDPFAVPAQAAERYKLSVLDTCGEETELSTAQRTVFLSSALVPNGVSLNWNEYEGNAVSQYYILRATVAGNFSVIDSVPFGQNTYNDLNPPVGNVYYAVEVYTNICSPDQSTDFLSSRSNETSVLFVNLNEAETALNDLTVAPNPFTESSMVSFTLSRPEQTIVRVHDLAGRIVAVLNDSKLSAGRQQIYFNVNADANEFTQGIYFISVQAGSFFETKRVVIIK